MARPQPGVAPPPQRYGLSVIYQIKDVPMHAMSIAHLGAMVPGLAAETGEANSSVKVNYLVGFGSLLGSFIWQGYQPRGFNELHLLKKEEAFQPNADGDLWIFFSSQSTEINHKLEECVQSYLSKIVIKLLNSLLALLIPLTINNAINGKSLPLASKWIVIISQHFATK